MRKVLCLAALVVAAGCAPEQPLSSRFVGATTLSDAVTRASTEYHVPREVLLALAYAEGRWAAPLAESAEPEIPGSVHAPPAVGPLSLRHGAALDTLRRASELLHVDVAAIESDLGLQVAGAAAVLAELGRQTAATDDIDSWAEAVARYSGIEGRAAQVSYARQVWDVLRHGRHGRAFTGEEIHLAGRAGPPIESLLYVEQSAQFSDDYPPARWVPAHVDNYGGLRGRAPRYIAIHDTEGSYAGTISWFQNPMAGVATHYVIRSSDGEVTQMIRDSYVAWHVANSYYNTNAIGIEHEGFYTAPERWYTEAMYVSSARLVRHLCDRYGIPIDREHIFGHYQVYRSSSTSTICTGSWDYCRGVTGNHVDPGPGWNWEHYMDLVRGGGTVGPMYDATLMNVSYPREMRAGERAVAYIEYRNTGSASWDVMNTRIGTTGPRDHEGVFYDTVNWISRNRPTAVDRATGPGEVGRFSFVVTAPEVTDDTTFNESYGLVQEGVTWFGPPDDAVTFTITVHPAATTMRDAGAPDANPDANPDAGIPAVDASRPDAGRTRVDVASDTAMNVGTMGGCGCKTTGRERSGASGVLSSVAFALALAARRRRRTPS